MREGGRDVQHSRTHQSPRRRAPTRLPWEGDAGSEGGRGRVRQAGRERRSKGGRRGRNKWWDGMREEWWERGVNMDIHYANKANLLTSHKCQPKLSWCLRNLFPPRDIWPSPTSMKENARVLSTSFSWPRSWVTRRPTFDQSLCRLEPASHTSQTAAYTHRTHISKCTGLINYMQIYCTCTNGSQQTFVFTLHCSPLRMINQAEQLGPFTFRKTFLQQFHSGRLSTTEIPQR